MELTEFPGESHSQPGLLNSSKDDQHTQQPIPFNLEHGKTNFVAPCLDLWVSCESIARESVPRIELFHGVRQEPTSKANRTARTKVDRTRNIREKE